MDDTTEYETKTSDTEDEGSETEDETSDIEVDTSEPEIGSSESGAGTSEMEAETSEMEAGTSELEAENSEMEAGTSESEAGTSEMEAGPSEMEAGPSKRGAGISKRGTGTCETEDESGETDDESSESEYENSESEAETSDSEAGTSKPKKKRTAADDDDGITIGCIVPKEYNIKRINFQFMKHIARGFSGDAYMVRKLTGPDLEKLYVLVTITKEKIGSKEYSAARRENKARPCIRGTPFEIKMHYVFQTDETLYLVFDYVPHGEMVRHLRHQMMHFEMRPVQICLVELLGIMDFMYLSGYRYRGFYQREVVVNRRGHIILTNLCLTRRVLKRKRNSTEHLRIPDIGAPRVIEYTKFTNWWALGRCMFDLLTEYSEFVIKAKAANAEASRLKLLRRANRPEGTVPPADSSSDSETDIEPDLDKNSEKVPKQTDSEIIYISSESESDIASYMARYPGNVIEHTGRVTIDASLDSEANSVQDHPDSGNVSEQTDSVTIDASVDTAVNTVQDMSDSGNVSEHTDPVIIHAPLDSAVDIAPEPPDPMEDSRNVLEQQASETLYVSSDSETDIPPDHPDVDKISSCVSEQQQESVPVTVTVSSDSETDGPSDHPDAERIIAEQSGPEPVHVTANTETDIVPPDSGKTSEQQDTATVYVSSDSEPDVPPDSEQAGPSFVSNGQFVQHETTPINQRDNTAGPSISTDSAIVSERQEYNATALNDSTIVSEHQNENDTISSDAVDSTDIPDHQYDEKSNDSRKFSEPTEEGPSCVSSVPVDDHQAEPRNVSHVTTNTAAPSTSTESVIYCAKCSEPVERSDVSSGQFGHQQIMPRNVSIVPYNTAGPTISNDSIRFSEPTGPLFVSNGEFEQHQAEPTTIPYGQSYNRVGPSISTDSTIYPSRFYKQAAGQSYFSNIQFDHHQAESINFPCGQTDYTAGPPNSVLHTKFQSNYSTRISDHVGPLYVSNGPFDHHPAEPINKTAQRLMPFRSVILPKWHSDDETESHDGTIVSEQLARPSYIPNEQVDHHQQTAPKNISNNQPNNSALPAKSTDSPIYCKKCSEQTDPTDGNETDSSESTHSTENSEHQNDDDNDNDDDDDDNNNDDDDDDDDDNDNDNDVGGVNNHGKAELNSSTRISEQADPSHASNHQQEELRNLSDSQPDSYSTMLSIWRPDAKTVSNSIPLDSNDFVKKSVNQDDDDDDDDADKADTRSLHSIDFVKNSKRKDDDDDDANDAETNGLARVAEYQDENETISSASTDSIVISELEYDGDDDDDDNNEDQDEENATIRLTIPSKGDRAIRNANTDWPLSGPVMFATAYLDDIDDELVSTLSSLFDDTTSSTSSMSDGCLIVSSDQDDTETGLNNSTNASKRQSDDDKNGTIWPDKRFRPN